MMISRRGLSLRLFACLMVPSQRLVATEEEDFWASFTAWQKAAADLELKCQIEDQDAAKQKRPSDRLRMAETGYEGFLKALGKGKGRDPIRESIQYSLIIMRIQYPTLGHDLDKMEKELRAFWSTQYKPNRTGGLWVLYNQYSVGKSYKECVRIAEECCKDYGWTWEARTWLERSINMMALVPEMKERMAVRIEEYADRHMTEIGAYGQLATSLNYLYADGEWDRAARIVDACLETYKDCEWEPTFLRLAVMIHTGRMDAAAKGVAGGEAKEAAKPAGGAVNAAPTIGAKVRAAQAKPGALGGKPVGNINSADRALAVATRCAEKYPHEPACVDAILKYFQWSIAEGKDEGGGLVGKYLHEYKATPCWGQLYQAGKKRWADRGDVAWLQLDGESETYVGVESNRTAKLKVVLAEGATNRMPYATALSDFVIANPDTVQGRTAMTKLSSLVLGGAWMPDFKEVQAIATNALLQSFPASPLFRDQTLAQIAASGVEPEGTEICKRLIQGAKAPLQLEWAYYWNHYRYIQRGRYSIPAFKLWVSKYKTSYLVPEQLNIVVNRAIYDQHTEEASEACDAAACKELANSLTMGSLLSQNVWQWIAYARDKAIKDEESGKQAGKKKGARVLEREALTRANEQANMIDEVQTAKVELAYLYWSTLVWEDSISFKSKAGQSGKQVLKQKDYKGTYYYFYGRVYEKDKK